jgi:hypothetical protein
MNPALFRTLLISVAALSITVLSAQTPVSYPTKDAQGNSIKKAKTGHITNYDESKVGSYTLPELLTLKSGEKVTRAQIWLNLRRPEILELYRENIYGYVPKTTPVVNYDLISLEEGLFNHTASRKVLRVTYGDKALNAIAFVVIYSPTHTQGPAPLLIHMTFAGAYPIKPSPNDADYKRRAAFNEQGPIETILSHGYSYAIIHYTEIEPDMPWSKPNRPIGVRALALAKNQTEPGPKDWGAISAWAWGVSKILDYFVNDPQIDSKKIGLIGHSRLGKTAIWTGAQDTRIALVFSSCAGELGTSLARRDYGETVDDMAENFSYQFCANIQKYRGNWNAMPVDTHMIIALNAPHPVFITAGTKDLWADPKGEFLAEVEAGKVYRLLGKEDLGTTQLPPLDTPLIKGDLGFHYHTGAHAILASDWEAFLKFTDKYFK